MKVVVADGEYVCKKSGVKLTKQLWNILRISIHSQEHSDGPGRKMSSYVGFENENGFRLLGIISFRSDSHTLKVRDDLIGWTTDQRAKNREHLVNMNVWCLDGTICLGHNYHTQYRWRYSILLRH